MNALNLDLQFNNLAASWTAINPDPSPLGRIHTAMTFDSKRGKIIMFGGNVDGLDNDTWEFDIETNTWTELFPLNSPPVKNYHKMVYHPVEDIIILYGGYTGNSVDSRLTQNIWAFNYTANTWTDLATPPGPSARRDPDMVYDPNNNKIILFGGQGLKEEGGLDQTNDLWEYDYSTNSWTELLPSIAPPARQDHKIIYDPVNKVFLLFGGTLDGRSVYATDTWAYSYENNKWTDLAPSVIPAGRRGFNMIYNTFNDTIIMFDGGDGTQEFKATWTFNYVSNTWEQIHTINANYPWGLNGVYDPQNNQIIAFGGGEADRPENTWILKFYDGPEYVPPSIPMTTEDSTTDETILFSNSTILLFANFGLIVLKYRKKIITRT